MNLFQKKSKKPKNQVKLASMAFALSLTGALFIIIEFSLALVLSYLAVSACLFYYRPVKSTKQEKVSFTLRQTLRRYCLPASAIIVVLTYLFFSSLLTVVLISMTSLLSLTLAYRVSRSLKRIS